MHLGNGQDWLKGYVETNPKIKVAIVLVTGKVFLKILRKFKQKRKLFPKIPEGTDWERQQTIMGLTIVNSPFRLKVWAYQ
jgi:hypothetical protein